MRTELEILDPEIVPGNTIRVERHRIRNFRLHMMLENISRLQISVMESHSNNTNGKVTPTDVRSILTTYENINGDLKFAIDHNDAPTGNYEEAYVILLLSPKEVQSIRNVKIKTFVKEMHFLCQTILGVDSANSPSFLDLVDHQIIERALFIAKASMDRWLGTGENAESLGEKVESFTKTGEVIPDIDEDWAQRLEPSKSRPLPQLDDVADIQGK